MIEPKLVQYGSMEIMNMHGVFDDVVTKLIGFPIDEPGFDPTTGHPHRKGPGMVVPTVTIKFQVSLTIVGTSKLTAPDTEGVCQQSSLRAVSHQGCRRLITIASLTARKSVV